MSTPTKEPSSSLSSTLKTVDDSDSCTDDHNTTMSSFPLIRASTRSVEDIFHSAQQSAHDAVETVVSSSTEAAKRLQHAAAATIHSIDESAHHLVEKVEEKVKEKVNEIALYSYHNLPEWLKDNNFIVNGYRTELKSYYECFRSMLYVHNETGNIYTHLIGFGIFGALALYSSYGYLSTHEFADKAMLWIFFIAAMTCLMMSTLFHLLFCHSPRVYGIFCRLDYSGIAILIAGSFYPFIYYGFYCHPNYQIAYLASITILGAGCVVATCAPRYNGPQFRTLRLLMFIGMGTSGVIPVCHYILMYGYSVARYTSSLDSVLVMGALYLIGAIVYGTRIPERFYPGKFDIWFNSHQLWHVLVVLAALVHYYAVYQSLQHRKTYDCKLETLQIPVAELNALYYNTTHSEF